MYFTVPEEFMKILSIKMSMYSQYVNIPSNSKCVKRSEEISPFTVVFYVFFSQQAPKTLIWRDRIH